MNRKLKVFIDAGHGGRDPGAVGNSMRESDIALEVSLLLETILIHVGFDIMLSRRTDVSLGINERWQMANTWGADLLFSVHVNAGGGTGVETLIPTASPNSPNRDLQANRKLAELISKTLATSLSIRIRRTRGVMLETETRHGSIGVLRHSRMTAVLVELAFIDAPANKPDINILRNHRREMAAALAKGICKYFKVNPNFETNHAAADAPDLDRTVSIKYRGRRVEIEAAKVKGRFITTFNELARIFPETEIKVRGALDLAGNKVGWDNDTNVILVN